MVNGAARLFLGLWFMHHDVFMPAVYGVQERITTWGVLSVAVLLPRYKRCHAGSSENSRRNTGKYPGRYLCLQLLLHVRCLPDVQGDGQHGNLETPLEQRVGHLRINPQTVHLLIYVAKKR